MTSHSDTQPIGPITVLQALAAAESEVVRLRGLRKTMLDTHRIWLLQNSQLKTQLDQAEQAMSLDQDAAAWAMRLGAEALAKQAEDFEWERSGWEAVLLVAHQPAEEAQQRASDLAVENRALRDQVRDLTSAAHQ